MPKYIVSVRFQQTIEAENKTEAFKAMLAQVTGFAEDKMAGWSMSDLDIWKQSKKEEEDGDE